MKAMGFGVAQRDGLRKIPIALIMALRWALECNGLVSAVDLRAPVMGKTSLALGLGDLGKFLFRVVVLIADRLQPNCFSLLSGCNCQIGKATFR
jgi:hypothetical protein